MYKYRINRPYISLESFILNIRERFTQNTQTIHKARNELKIITEVQTEIVVKAFKVPNILRRIIYTFFRDSKAKKSYEYSLKIGEFTPQPIGYIEFYHQKLLADSYFLAEKFEYDFTIREPLIKEGFHDKKKILEAFARFTFDLHQNGIFHQDYSPGNILIKKEDKNYHFKIVDINRMTFGELSIEKRFKNFSKLWISDEDLHIVVYQYALLLKADQGKCYEIALKYSHALKKRINMKKRLKGIKVVD